MGVSFAAMGGRFVRVGGAFRDTRGRCFFVVCDGHEVSAHTSAWEATKAADSARSYNTFSTVAVSRGSYARAERLGLEVRS